MIPSESPRPTKRVRFASHDFAQIAHIDHVAQEDRPVYWYTPAEYSVIEREIKQTVRRLRKRAAEERSLQQKQQQQQQSESSSSLCCPPKPTDLLSSPTTTLLPPRWCDTSLASTSSSSSPKYCDRGLEDFVHHYETKELKTTIAKVILAEQELQRARGICDPLALMRLSMACTRLSRDQAIALGEQDAQDAHYILRVVEETTTTTNVSTDQPLKAAPMTASGSSSSLPAAAGAASSSRQQQQQQQPTISRTTLSILESATKVRA